MTGAVAVAVTLPILWALAWLAGEVDRREWADDD